jgi:hypothetical protein
VLWYFFALFVNSRRLWIFIILLQSNRYVTEMNSQMNSKDKQVLFDDEILIAGRISIICGQPFLFTLFNVVIFIITNAINVRSARNSCDYKYVVDIQTLFKFSLKKSIWFSWYDKKFRYQTTSRRVTSALCSEKLWHNLFFIVYFQMFFLGKLICILKSMVAKSVLKNRKFYNNTQ